MIGFKAALNEMARSEEDILVANKTSRSGGAVGSKALVPRAVMNYLTSASGADKMTVLDFGAGKDALHALWLRDQGYNVTAYEFGGNAKAGLHDKKALSRKYNVVYASNVLNVQNSQDAFDATMKELRKVVKSGGVLIANLPLSPRKGAWNFTAQVAKSGSKEEKSAAKEADKQLLQDMLGKYKFGFSKVGSGNNDPVFVAKG